jgi:hypothetical protein
MASGPEQRTTRRFNLSLPLTIKVSDTQESHVASATRDVSARGVLFYLDSEIAEGSPIEFTMTLPPEITLTESIKVRCLGKVVRVLHPKGEHQVGIAAAIEQYEFLNE